MAPSDTCYTVTVATAQLSGGKPFDGKLFVTIHGEDGDTAECALESWWSSELKVRGGAVGYSGLLG